jgi:uncharacterized protein (DUF1778 family)
VPAAADAGVQPLAAFVVRAEHEGKAKALMEQRRSMNLTNSLSSTFLEMSPRAEAASSSKTFRGRC